jgi:ABC-2 type transport system permease protein
VKAIVIATTELRRLLRWRANVFFLFLLPMLIILLLGAAFGGADRARIGVVGGSGSPLARAFIADLRAQPSADLRLYSSRQSLQRAVSRGDVEAGLEIPDDYDLRLERRKTVSLGYFGRPDSVAQQLRATVQSVAGDQARLLIPAQLFAQKRHVTLDAALTVARAAATNVPRLDVKITGPNGHAYTATTTGRFETGASTQLLLFIFLTSLNGAAGLIETRRLGVARRMLSTPTSLRTIIAGQLLGRLLVALLQALIIILGTLLFFGVDWGNPFGTAAVIVAFCLVGTGAAVLLASFFSTEQQAAPIALLLGLGLAALGGSMAPLEVFPHTARTIAHFTPHAWANDAMTKLLQQGAGLGNVLPQVGILLAFAAAAIGIATWRLRHTLTT